MAKEYDNTNTGALFKAKEQKTDKHPGYTGTLNVGGVEYWLAGWVKEDRNRNKYFSLSVKAKEQAAPEKREERPKERPTIHDIESDIPFDRIRHEYIL